jgi:TonB family protein
VIHFDFDDRYQDELIVGSAISRREGFLLSVAVHAVILVVALLAPSMSFLQPSPEEIEARRQEELRRLREAQRFVFVQPRIDREEFPPLSRAELSDMDRRARARERAVTPQNPLPFSRGDSFERTETDEARREEERKQGPEATTPPDTEPPRPEPEERLARALPPADFGVRPAPTPSRPAPGALGEALRNLQRYVQNQTFSNPQGGVNDPGSVIQFDTKGVEFGPWVRRFVAQIKRNWFIPHAALAFRGRVVIQFNVHKNGAITDLAVVGPSDIDAFNRAAFNAILGSNPTEPLPPEYPEPKAFFTVTFYYNEQPPLF